MRRFKAEGILIVEILHAAFADDLEAIKVMSAPPMN